MEDLNLLNMAELERLIHEQKTTKTALSLAMGFSQAGLNKMIKRQSMETKVLVEVARSLGVHPLELFSRLMPETMKREFAPFAPANLAAEDKHLYKVGNEVSDQELKTFLRTNAAALQRLISDED